MNVALTLIPRCGELLAPPSGFGDTPGYLSPQEIDSRSVAWVLYAWVNVALIVSPRCGEVLVPPCGLGDTFSSLPSQADSCTVDWVCMHG